jgi:WD40 repeat protein
LLSDYDPLNSQEDLRLIQGAIRLSAHVLFRDPGQLPGQLTGRLAGIQMTSIESLIEEVPSTTSFPWLRPLTGSLTPPGGPLIRTLEGHTCGVSAVAVSPDGRRAISGSGDNTLKVWDLETGKILTELSADGPITAVALSRDKWTIVAGDSSGRVHLLTLENPDA